VGVGGTGGDWSPPPDRDLIACRYRKLVPPKSCSRPRMVRSPIGVSPPFPVSVGVHQGSALSPLLFILCMDTATADIKQPHPWSLLYADDVFLASETRQQLQEQTQAWNDRLQAHGLEVNPAKTEYLECGTQTDGSITTDFKYLGSTLRCDGDVTPEVRARIKAAWVKWRQLTAVLCDRRMPRRLKGKIYKTVVRPVALYVAECWPAATNHEKALHAMEMRMLRWSLGLTRLDHATNVDVRGLL